MIRFSVLLTIFLTCAPARAGDVRPPELVRFTEAPYPEKAEERRLGGTVVLTLLVSAEGAVTEALVHESSGHDFFDRAAREAALSFRFLPATSNGKPIAARVLYAYDFEPAEAPRAQTSNASSPSVDVPEVPGQPASFSSPPRSVSPSGATEVSQGVEGEEAEVVVRGYSEADRLRRSAQAVHVFETEGAKRQTADLGEVLARKQGVGVRRGGGLGSRARFSLNGLTDDQIRFFVDGVPLEFAGYPFGISNVPLNLVERVEIYRGVVPVRFGADALGGAVHMVTDDGFDGTHGSASYQVGSFGTHRFTGNLRTFDEPTGSFTRAAVFHDYAHNDYPIDVQLRNDRGRLSPARVYRFHDAYRATGVNVETGLARRTWAKRVSVKAFITDYGKDLQHNPTMTVPYGAVEHGELTTGATLRYENVFARRFTVETIAGYSSTTATFLDVDECVYDWLGQCVHVESPGEVDSRPHDQIRLEHDAFGRINLGWLIHPQHALRLSVAPTYSTRTGDEREQPNPNIRDPLTARRDLMTLVGGIEYEVDLFDDRFENIAFFKDYVQIMRSEEPQTMGPFRRQDRDTHRLGLGNSLRYRLLEWLDAKTSYEWATRLPRADEIFGDGAFIIDNLELEPETSHNVNLGMAVDAHSTPTGAYRSEIHGFLRETDQLIVLLGNERVQSYQNVLAARSFGVEGAFGWTSPGDYVALDGNATYLDFRNTSRKGTFSDFAGDRVPNRPYLFANGSARFQVRSVAAAKDELALTWNTRYVHEFFVGWESVGLRESKAIVPSQLLHSIALTYLVHGDPLALSFTSEVQNLTDESTFDFYGAQRPGRAFHFKTTAEF